MAALGFKKQFAGPVERREKRQSIRANAARFKVGRPIQLYTGMRTKACRKLVDVDPTCVSIEAITVHEWDSSVMIDGLVLFGDELASFAMADGFTTVEDFFDFFTQADGMDFAGWLIRWDW